MKNFIANIFLIPVFIFSTSYVHAQQTNDIVKLRNILKKEFVTYPKMEIQDVYKLLQQAAMGSEHALKDTASARRWMENEIAGLNFNKKDELIDTISPGGEIVRVNLRPYLNLGYDPNLLLNAFIETANKFKGSKENLKLYLDTALKMMENGELKLSYSEAKKYFDELREEGFPAVHHSKIYEKLYLPAYRVVDIKYIGFIKK